MLKKSLIAIAVLAIAMPALAGSLKVHEWESSCVYVAQDICVIDILIDVGYYIVVDNQDAITLTQAAGTNNYSGTYTSNVDANFDAILSVSIAESGDVAISELTATITGGGTVVAGVTSVLTVDIVANGVAIEDLIAGTTGQKIANMTISVVPA